MRKAIATLGVLLSANALAVEPAPEKHPVSVYADSIGTERIGDVLLRYVLFDLTQDYPCIRFESLVPINRKLIERKDVCLIRAPDGRVLNPHTDVAMADHINFRFAGNALHYRTVIIERIPGPTDTVIDCRVEVDRNGQLSGPHCIDVSKPSPDGERH